MSEDGFNSILAKCRDMIGLDASLHSVMLQSWFLHTLDFLILPSPIHVLLVIGWDEPCSVPNRTLCCDMELHLANRPDPEGLTIDLLIEGIQISKVPADPLPPGSAKPQASPCARIQSHSYPSDHGCCTDFYWASYCYAFKTGRHKTGPDPFGFPFSHLGADLLQGSAYSYWHGIGHGDLLQELQQSKSLSLPKHNKGRGRPSMTDCSAEELRILGSEPVIGLSQNDCGPRLPMLRIRICLQAMKLKIYPDYCYWFIANCWISDSNYPCLLQPKYLITNRNLQLRPTDESQDYGGSMAELEILNALALGCYPILYSAKE
ncbi:hypothetical protein VNO77_39148 [Canavalia gladiata]|uniref:Uncharacterized protein n=1 Tax=Canavalia gladiata TaxID=3824 RepID=A0AAN9PWV9_CANGL